MDWTSRIKSHFVAKHDGWCLGYTSACGLLGIRCYMLLNGWGEAERGKLPLGFVLAPNRTSRGKVGLFKENKSSEDGGERLINTGRRHREAVWLWPSGRKKVPHHQGFRREGRKDFLGTQKRQAGICCSSAAKEPETKNLFHRESFLYRREKRNHTA